MTNQIDPHPEFPFSCGDEQCCTGIPFEDVTAECKREECKGKANHPEGYHRYDDAVMNTIENAAVERKLESVFEELWDMMVDADMPFPTEYENGGDQIDDFRDWYTTEVIKRFFSPR